MDFSKLVSELKALDIKETRFDTEHYYEIAVRNKSLEAAKTMLAKYFGPEVKDPTPEMLEKLEIEGGLRPQQTLYYSEKDGQSYCAMVWPWADESSFTLRVSLLHE